MSSFEFVIPTPLRGVELVPEVDHVGEDGYQQGFQAGYKTAQWKATKELHQQKEQATQQLVEQLTQLQSMHERLQRLVSEHMPQLLLAAFSRVLDKHRFTDEEIFAEVESLVKELALAKKITIECSQQDLDMLRGKVAAVGFSLTQASVEWKGNPGFKKGEFILESDLGVLDGRLSARKAHIHHALAGG